jgi:hypothetical protein
VTPTAYLPIRGKVQDDYGVASVVAEMAVNESTIPALPLDLADTELSGQIDLQALSQTGKIQLQPGSTLGLNVLATDRFDLEGQKHTGRGQPQQLAVVTKDKLMAILDRQELELRQRLEQIISELNQMEEVLSSLTDQLGGEKSTANRTSSAAIQQLAAWQQSSAPSSTAMGDQQAQVRLAVLRAQQTQMQTDKSRQELVGIANRVEHLRLQLKHNRTDSLDREQRLLEKVQIPLSEMLASEYKQLENWIAQLQSASMRGEGKGQAIEATKSLREILAKLDLIRENMMDIESWNELIDLLRTLYDDQEELLKAAQLLQRASILELNN